MVSEWIIRGGSAVPIKPENKGRYPKDWKAIRKRILDRAFNRCEGSPAFPDCRICNGWFRNNTTGETSSNPMQAEAWEFADGDSVTRIVLTIGHLDHTPENCSDDNLRAWCQRCHLNYDAKMHAQASRITRRKGKAVGELFHVESTDA